MQCKNTVAPMSHKFLPHFQPFNKSLYIIIFIFYKNKKSCNVNLPTLTQTQKFRIMQFARQQLPLLQYARQQSPIMQFLRYQFFIVQLVRQQIPIAQFARQQCPIVQFANQQYLQKKCSLTRYTNVKLIKCISNSFVALLSFSFTKTTCKDKFSDFFTTKKPFGGYFQ